MAKKVYRIARPPVSRVEGSPSSQGQPRAPARARGDAPTSAPAARVYRIALRPDRPIRRPNGEAWFLVEGDRWQCQYGCKTFRASEQPADGAYHAANCPYWFEEGIDQTPF